MEEQHTEQELINIGADLILDYHLRVRGQPGDVDHLATTGILNSGWMTSVGEYFLHGLEHISLASEGTLFPEQLFRVLYSLAKSVSALQDAALRRIIKE